MKLRKDDIVQVMTGKYKGQQGRVIKVIKEKNRVVVEGVNNVKKHTTTFNNHATCDQQSNKTPICKTWVLHEFREG